MRSIGDLVSEVAGDETLTIDEKVASVDGYEEVESAEPAPDGMTIIPGSLCMSCQGTGVTRMMFTRIPHFRELIVSSFECDDCGERNTEVQFGGEIQEMGVRYRATIRDGVDLNRQVIKSDSARMTVPALELEIPAATQRGIISTIEGVLSRAARELEAMQPIRRATEPDQAKKIQGVVDALRCMAAGDELPFVVELDDPSGNSFVQARDVASPDRDADLELVRYDRSEFDNMSLGLHPSGAAPLGEETTPTSVAQEERRGADQAQEERTRTCRTQKLIDGVDRLISNDEVMTFQVSCPHCRADGTEQMCIAKIPHFKECVIMSFACAKCGFRNSEVKAGGAVPLKGQRTTLTCADASDLNRDILKSDTASLAIPSLALELSRGTLGGVYTTVEGILRRVKENLRSGNPFAAGDSADQESRARFASFLARLDELIEGRMFPFQLQLADPLANSFIGPRRTTRDGANPIETLEEEERRTQPRSEDDRLLVQQYARSWDEDEELGLHDIDTFGINNSPVVDEEPEQFDSHVQDHPVPNFARGCDDAIKQV